MPGWNLKSGPLVDYDVSEDEFWSLFNYAFSDSCRKTNTYKFGLIKSICDQIYDLYSQGSLGFFLSYEKIFAKFTENYWNLVNKYHLKQMQKTVNSEYSKIEQIIMASVTKYGIPENVGFLSVNEEDRKQIIRQVTPECKKYVIGALYNDFEGKLYSFDLSGEGIYLSYGAYCFISKYKMEIEKLNYYSWARFLERVNDDDVLLRVLDKLDLAVPQRNDLSVYREILYKEFQENTCFYCGKKLDYSAHVDHFIPWSFVKNDNLWNFVLACPRCNIRKSNSLAGKDYLIKLEARNSILVDTSGPEKAFIQKEFRGYQRGLLDRIWEYAKMSGVRERPNIA